MDVNGRGAIVMRLRRRTSVGRSNLSGPARQAISTVGGFEELSERGLDQALLDPTSSR